MIVINSRRLHLIRELLAALIDALRNGDLAGHVRAWRDDANKTGAPQRWIETDKTRARFEAKGGATR